MASRDLDAQSPLPPKQVSIGNVQALTLFENGEQLCSQQSVMPTAAQICRELALACDVVLAQRNMPFGLREMLFETFPVHRDSPAPVCLCNYDS